MITNDFLVHLYEIARKLHTERDSNLIPKSQWVALGSKFGLKKQLLKMLCLWNESKNYGTFKNIISPHTYMWDCKGNWNVKSSLWWRFSSYEYNVNTVSIVAIENEASFHPSLKTMNCQRVSVRIYSKLQCNSKQLRFLSSGIASVCPLN